jgi:hypothetical protein
MERSTSPSGRLTQFGASRTIFAADAVIDAHSAGSAPQECFQAVIWPQDVLRLEAGDIFG